jgi:hypothetical protein
MGIIWLLSSLFESLLFVPPALLLWLGIPKLYWWAGGVTQVPTTKAILNKSQESEHPCLVPDFRGSGFSFSPFSMMLAVGLSYNGYYVEVNFFYS